MADPLPKTLVFDLDGTLVDSVRDLLPALNRTIALDGLEPIARSDVGHVVGQGAMAMIARAFDLRDTPLDNARQKQLLEHFLAFYEESIADETVYFDGLWPALDTLEKEGWRFAICTNKYEHLARKLMAGIGGMERFAALTGGDSFSFKKPDPRHILETVKLAKGDPARTIMVGDSNNDIDAAKAGDVPSIAVTFGYTEIPARELGATHVIEHFDALVEAVTAIDASGFAATPS